MNKTDLTTPGTSFSRVLLRSAALALACGLLQALLPRYTLGAAVLAPLSVVLGVTAAAVLARGRWVLPAALLGLAVGDLAVGIAGPAALIEALVLGLQALVVGWWMRSRPDPDGLRLDTWPRLRSLVLVAAPAAAAVGLLAGLLGQWGIDAAAALPLSRPQLAGAVGRLVADWSGIVAVAPILLCWLAAPQTTWRPRRRPVALPLLLLVAVMLPGFHEVARRDETRLQNAFDRDAAGRRLRIQQLLDNPLDAALALSGVASAGGQAPPAAVF